jgi:hypothetical protein
MLSELGPQGPFPLLAADKARFQDTITLLREVYSGGMSARMRLRGLELHFAGQAVPETMQHTMQLAERIILIHKGELIRDENGCSVLIPWPTYTGQTPARPAADTDKYLLALSPLPVDAASLFGLPIIGSLEKALALPERIALILWDADAGKETGDGSGAGAEVLAACKKAAALRSQAVFFHTPFLCFGGGLSGETLSAAVDAKLQNEKTLTILFIGIDGDLFPLWIRMIRSASCIVC